MRKIETHAHTKNFSIDAKHSVEEILKEAEKHSFASICLTDHYDKDGIDGKLYPQVSAYGEQAAEGEWIFDLEAYFAKLMPIKQARQLKPEATQLQIGIELGYSDYLLPVFQQVLRDWPFDQVISSVHFIDGIDIFFDRHFYEQGKKKAYAYWMENLIQMLESDLDFDVLGHFDYVIRYAPYEDVSLNYDDFPDEFDTLLKLLRDKEVALEINTRYRYKRIDNGAPDPGFVDTRIIKRYLDLGGELISLSSDTHESGSMGRLFDESMKELHGLGVERLCYFKERRPHAIYLF